MTVKLGDKISIINQDGQYTPWTYKNLIVEHIAYSEKQHCGYDRGMNGQALVSCKGLPVSLYEYEFEVI
jgi:hypothetical protein